MPKLPNGWAQKPLSSLVNEFRTGFAQRPSSTGSEIPQLRPHNISPNGKISLDGLKFVSVTERQVEALHIRKGDVLFNNTNSQEWVGKTAYMPLDYPYVFSNHMTRIRVNRDLLDPRYLAYYLNYQRVIGGLRRWVQPWVNQAGINSDQLKTLNIILPPSVHIQEQIADILDAADEARRLRAEADTQMEKLIPELFYEMFGDPATNPKGWKECSMSDPQVGTLDRGRSRNRPRNSPHLYGGSYPFVQTGEIANSGGFITSYKQTYSDAGLAQSRMWPAGTLCITIAANIAKTGILTFDACFPDSVVGFLAGEQTVVEYVRWWFVTMEASLEKAAPQLAQKNINLDILGKLKIPIPPYFIQELFATRVTEIRALQDQQTKSRKELDILFDSLLHLAFTGELSSGELQPVEVKTVDYLPEGHSPEAAVDWIYETGPPQLAEKTACFSDSRKTPMDRIVWKKLSKTQQSIYLLTRFLKDSFDVERVSDVLKNVPGHRHNNEQLRDTLDLLVTLGFLVRQSSDLGDFWRLPQPGLDFEDKE